MREMILVLLASLLVACALLVTMRADSAAIRRAARPRHVPSVEGATRPAWTTADQLQELSRRTQARFASERP